MFSSKSIYVSSERATVQNYFNRPISEVFLSEGESVKEFEPGAIYSREIKFVIVTEFGKEEYRTHGEALKSKSARTNRIIEVVKFTVQRANKPDNNFQLEG